MCMFKDTKSGCGWLIFHKNISFTRDIWHHCYNLAVGVGCVWFFFGYKIINCIEFELCKIILKGKTDNGSSDDND